LFFSLLIVCLFIYIYKI